MDGVHDGARVAQLEAVPHAVRAAGPACAGAAGSAGGYSRQSTWEGSQQSGLARRGRGLPAFVCAAGPSQPGSPVLMSHTLVPCFSTFSASMDAYLVCSGWGERRGGRGGGRRHGATVGTNRKACRPARGLVQRAGGVPIGRPQGLSRVPWEAGVWCARWPLRQAGHRGTSTGPERLTGCHMRKAEPKQAEKVASGSVTPCSVPATLAV